jgi:adenylate kinase
MDGFPRTVAQAEAVDHLLASRDTGIDHVLCFDVPKDELVRRMQGRAEAEGRNDDNPEAFRKRLEVYLKQTAPLVEHYEQRDLVTNIHGLGSVDEVAARVQEALEV